MSLTNWHQDFITSAHFCTSNKVFPPYDLKVNKMRREYYPRKRWHIFLLIGIPNIVLQSHISFAAWPISEIILSKTSGNWTFHSVPYHVGRQSYSLCFLCLSMMSLFSQLKLTECSLICALNQALPYLLSQKSYNT